MKFKKELEGKEVIDKDGNTVGVIEDLEMTDKGRVTHILILPRGIVSKLTRESMTVKVEDIATISRLVMLNKTEDELKGVYKCKDCGQVFESEQSREKHNEKEHKKSKKK